MQHAAIRVFTVLVALPLPGQVEWHDARSLTLEGQGFGAALRAQFDGLRAAGVKGLFYLAGAALLGDDGEATVDGSHPTDLGFARLAEMFATKLREILDK